MNTPRSKPIKRHATTPRKKGRKRPPDGTYTNRLPSNTEHAGLLGELIAYWTHVEEQMIEVLGLLLGERKLPTRQIFRSLKSEHARIEMLKALLEEAPINKDKGPEYDGVISRFGSLNAARNNYVHGLWSIHQETGRIFLAEASSDETQIFEQREVTTQELRQKLQEMGDLWKSIFRLTDPDMAERLWPSPNRKPQQHVSKTKRLRLRTKKQAR